MLRDNQALVYLEWTMKVRNSSNSMTPFLLESILQINASRYLSPALIFNFPNIALISTFVKTPLLSLSCSLNNSLRMNSSVWFSVPAFKRLFLIVSMSASHYSLVTAAASGSQIYHVFSTNLMKALSSKLDIEMSA